MPCEKYQAALIEAAITGDDLTPEMRSHVDACTPCTAELSAQRSLVASIDANLHRTMNAPLPPALLQRFEARLAQQKPRRSLNLNWLYTGAALATAAAMILFALPHLRAHKSNSQPATLAQTTKSSSDHRPEIMTAILQPASSEEIRRDREQHRGLTAHIVSASTAPMRTEPEILVPPDEQIALAKFIAHRNRRRDFVVALATPVHQGFETAFKTLEIPDINTTEIFIAPIATETRR
jgi:hypothetical protein